MVGPSQLAKKASKFAERAESGYFPDCQDAGRKLPEPKDLKIKEKTKVKSNYPPKKKLKPKSKFGLNCCASLDIVNGNEMGKMQDQLLRA